MIILLWHTVVEDCKFTEALRPIVKYLHRYLLCLAYARKFAVRVSLRGRLQVTSEILHIHCDLCVVRIADSTIRRDLSHLQQNLACYVSHRLHTIYRDPRHYRDVQLRPFPATIYMQPIHQSAPCSVRGDWRRNGLLGLS